jgi:hypothetical protein
MSGDGDARSLEAAASALIAQHAALVAQHAADEDDLRHRAAALEAELRRLQGSLVALDPSAVDKVAFYPPPPPSGVGPDSIPLSSPRGWPQVCTPLAS